MRRTFVIQIPDGFHVAHDIRVSKSAGATEYLVNCQSTPDKRDKIEKACRTVLDSIKHV